jgi:hypothetical protein
MATDATEEQIKKAIEVQETIKRVNKLRGEINQLIINPRLVGEDFKKRENYTDINGKHPKKGKGVKAENVVFEKSELAEGKLLVDEKLKERAKKHMQFLKKHEVVFFVF